MPIKPGTPVKIITETNFRAESKGAKTDAKIIDVLETGDIVEIEQIDASHAKRGGWFLWARITH